MKSLSASPSRRTLALGAALLSSALCAPLAAGCSSSDPVTPGADAGSDSPFTQDTGLPSLPDAGPDAAKPDADTSDAGTDAPDGDTADAACTGADLAARWAAMIAAPIKPPNHYGNLDLDGPTGHGLTIEEAEAINCTGTITTANDAGKWPSMTWGPHGEVNAGYDQLTHVIGAVILDAAPPLTFKSRDGNHTYVLSIGKATTKDGAPFAIDWSSQVTANTAATELDDAMRATFAPTLPVDADCGAVTGSTANCDVYADDADGHSEIGFRGTDAAGAMKVGLWVYFQKGTNVLSFFNGQAVLPPVGDGGTDGGDGGDGG